MPELHDFEYVLEPQPEGGYLIYVPELPGLATEGATREEAIAMLRVALPAYLESKRDRDQRASPRSCVFSLHGNVTSIDTRR